MLEGASEDAAANGCESLVLGRGCLAAVVVSPTDGRPIGTEGASMERTAADGCESLVLGRGRLACLIQAPTDRRALASKGAGVETPTADVSELHALRGRRYAVSHKPPTDGGSIVLQCASMRESTADGNKSTCLPAAMLGLRRRFPSKEANHRVGARMYGGLRCLSLRTALPQGAIPIQVPSIQASRLAAVRKYARCQC